MKRLRKTVAALGTRPALEMVQDIVPHVTDFTDSVIQQDDVRVLITRVGSRQ